MYPGVIWHDDIVALIMLMQGVHTEHVSLLWQLITYPLVYLSGNILPYAIFQQLIVALSAVYGINKLLGLGLINRKRGAIIIAVFYGLCPTYLWFNQMLSVDVMFATLLLPLTAILIEAAITKGENLGRLSNVIILALLLFLIFEFRKNAALIIPTVAVALFILCKGYRGRIVILFSSVIIAIVMFLGATRQVFGDIISDTNGEMLSVPFQQVGRVYSQDLYIPPNIGSVFDALHTPEYWKKSYDPQIADPLKNGVKVDESFIKSWFSLGLKYPNTYIQAYAALDYPFFKFGPNDVVGNYAIALTVSKQESIRHAYAGMCSPDKCNAGFMKQILASGTKSQLGFATVPSRIADNNIPIISGLFKYIFFNTGLPFYLMLVALVIALIKQSSKLIIATIPLWCILLSYFLTAPVGQFRYSLQLYYMLPLVAMLSWRELSTSREC